MSLGPRRVNSTRDGSGNLLHLLQCVAEDHVMTLKLKVSQKLLLLQHQWEPQDIIGPHLTEGDFIAVKPLRPHFWIKQIKTNVLATKWTPVWGYILLLSKFLNSLDSCIHQVNSIVVEPFLFILSSVPALWLLLTSWHFPLSALVCLLWRFWLLRVSL